MATVRTRKARGSRTQALVAEYYQRLWPSARTNPNSYSGRDVLEVPVSIEVKGRRSFDPLAWVRQARKAERPGEDEFPAHVVMRPDGLGEQSVGDWLVIRRLADDVDMMVELVELRQFKAAVTPTPGGPVDWLPRGRILETEDENAS